VAARPLSAGHEARTVAVGQRRRRYALGLLLVVYVLNFVAADVLCMRPSTLRSRLEKLGIERPVVASVA
jgi:hypothetical protein